MKRLWIAALLLHGCGADGISDGTYAVTGTRTTNTCGTAVPISYAATWTIAETDGSWTAHVKETGATLSGTGSSTSVTLAGAVVVSGACDLYEEDSVSIIANGAGGFSGDANVALRDCTGARCTAAYRVNGSPK